MRNAKRFLLFSFYFLVFTFTGCATAPLTKPPIPQAVPGIYHRVERGQTLWRISKIYDIDLDEIARFNRILDTTSIETGQLIFIPYRQKAQGLPVKLTSEDFIWPIKGRVIASFGQTYNNMINKGIDIQPYNNLNVVASRSGKVVFCADNFGYFGKTIIIEHADGFLTVYARNSQVFVKPAETVQKGSTIAKSNTCLHFEIRKGHIPQNPNFYLSH